MPVTTASDPNDVLLEVADLSVHIPSPRGMVEAVDGVSFTIGRGEVVGIVGESGCGKSMLALSHHAAGARARADRRRTGRCWLGRDLLGLSEREMRKVRGNEIGMIFQDPSASLNPVMRIGRQIGETIEAHYDVCPAIKPGPGPSTCCAPSAFRSRRARRTRLSAPIFRRHAPAGDDRHRHGQPAQASDRRRAHDGARRHGPGADHGAAARDERGDRNGHHPDHPQHRARLALLLARPGHVCRAHRRIGPTTRGLRQPAASLYRCAAERRSARRERGWPAGLPTIEGRPPDLARKPAGCAFYPRCAVRQEICATEQPPAIAVGPERSARCWLLAEGRRTDEFRTIQ